MKKVLVTGGAGFIGSHFIRQLLNHRPDLQAVNLDKLTYAGNPNNLRDIEQNKRYQFIHGDVSDAAAVARALAGCDTIVHFAAETHVDRSIRDAADFLRTNVIGTYTLLEAARTAGIERYLQISTDEVYGSLLDGAASETAPLHPNSPYAASKAAADHLALSYYVTFQFPVIVTRASNNFGPCQFPEKFIPLMVTNTLEDIPLPIYGDGQYVREWLYVEDFCEAILLILEQGTPGEIYNVGSQEYRKNLDVVGGILKALGKPPTLIRHVQDRLGHDRRYAINSDKIRLLGWRPRHRFEEALGSTIQWYQVHPEWWRPLKSATAGLARKAIS